MADNFIQVPPQSTGLKIDASELVVNTQTVERQRIVLSDPTTAAALSAVANSAPAGTEYGIITRNIPSGTQTTASKVATSGGCTISHTVAAASTNATSIKASPGQIYLVTIFNAAMYPIFVKFYNKASAPTVGTDAVVMTLGVQSGVSIVVPNDLGDQFTTGIAMSITKLIADTDTTVVAAGDCVVDVHYA